MDGQFSDADEDPPANIKFDLEQITTPLKENNTREINGPECKINPNIIDYDQYFCSDEDYDDDHYDNLR